MNVFTPLDHTIPWVIQAALVAAGLVLLAGVLVRRKLATQGGGLVPDEGVSLRNLIEVLIESLANLAQDRMGEDWRRYFPIVATMFFFILVSNLMGLIPGLAGATSDVNTTFSWAVISWVFYTWIGFSKHKGRYFVKFMGPSFFEKEMFGRTVHFRVLSPLMLPLEILLDFARIGTLYIRLLANMFADHTVVMVWIKLVPVGIPAIFMGLGLIVAILQAFIFSLLTMVYIGLALDEPH
jgi:F-type H+-transporting ATPase subunit a